MNGYWYDYSFDTMSLTEECLGVVVVAVNWAPSLIHAKILWRRKALDAGFDKSERRELDIFYCVLMFFCPHSTFDYKYVAHSLQK